MTGRERILALIEGRKPDCLPFMPITMMFAADVAGVQYGRYAADHRVLADAQIRTAEAFDFDFVSTISDPAREVADCGGAVVYFDDQPPAVDETHARLARKTDLASIKVPDPLGGGRMNDRVDGVALLKQRVGSELLVEGWIEGPVAEAADLRGINTLMMDFYEDPDFVRDLFAFVLDLELQFAKVQIQAGADIIGIGDAAASLVGPEIYEKHVWPYEKLMVDGVHDLGGGVRLHICGRTAPILEGMGRLGCEIVDLDWPAPVDAARAAMGEHQILLGNIDPVAVLRNGSPESVTEAIADCHKKAGKNYIVSAGCEVVRDTPQHNVQAMHDYARSHTYGV